MWIALAACLGSCYFAACQIALKNFSRSRLQEMLDARRADDVNEQQGQARYDRFIEELPRLLVMTGFVRSVLNLMIVLSVLYMTERLGPDLNKFVAYLIAFSISGVLSTVFSVTIPVSVAEHFPEKLLSVSIRLLEIGLIVFMPVGALLNVIDPIIKRFSRSSEQELNDQQISQEIISVVEEHKEQGAVDQTQRQMLEGVFELPSTTAGQIMTPRTDITGIEAGASLDEVKAAVLRGGYSRIPVYQQSLDNIVGVLYAKDLIEFLGQDKPIELRKILRQAMMVPESKPLRELLAEFKARKVHIAIVLDEYGGTAGLVTIEDIIEEIFGDIQDEYESQQERPAVRKTSDTTADVDARAYIDELKEQLGVELPEDADYDTLGGFVFSTLGHIPGVGEQFEYKNIRFTVTEAERTKVKTVRVEVLDKPATNEPGTPPPD